MAAAVRIVGNTRHDKLRLIVELGLFCCGFGALAGLRQESNQHGGKQ